MARGGSKPGERRGGRQKGVPNKRTVLKREFVEEQVRQIRQEGKKLPSEVLHDFMMLFMGMASHFQPRAPGQTPNPNEDRDLFYKSVDYVLEFATAAAPYFSPKLRALAVGFGSDTFGGKSSAGVFAGKTIDLNAITDEHELDAIESTLAKILVGATGSDAADRLVGDDYPADPPTQGRAKATERA